jgi:hypothetical protein
VTLISSSGPFSTGGETGSIIWVGTFYGHRVTGPGSFGDEGIYTGTCVLVHTSGRYLFTVPADAGPMHFVATYAANSIGLVARTDGSLPGARLTRVDIFVPTRGDCVTTPATELYLV